MQELTQIQFRKRISKKENYFEHGQPISNGRAIPSTLKIGDPNNIREAVTYDNKVIMKPGSTNLLNYNHPISNTQIRMGLNNVYSRIQMQVESKEEEEEIQMKPEVQFEGLIANSSEPNDDNIDDNSNNNKKTDTANGKHLLANELAHVVQQGRNNTDISFSRLPSVALHDLIQRQTARPRPWGEVPGEFAIGTRQVNLFNHEFPQGTSLESALQWIFDNSSARYTDFQFQDPDETMRADIYQGMQESTGQPTFYQEVALSWQIRRRRFVAFTLRSSTSAAIDPSQGDFIFVAHTHPTPQQLQSSGRVSWNTSQPSPEDARRIQDQQRYSIVCHRDTRDNRTPASFIYDVSGVVQSFNGQNAFQEAAARFLELEHNERSIAARVVGRYRH